MRQIINEISKGKNIDDNLKKYADGFSEINNKFAYIRLALNYYTFLQMQQDENDVISSDIVLELNKMNEVIADMSEEDISVVEDMRNNIIRKMQALTYYVDKYNVYEFAYNRVEYKYHDYDMPANYSDEEFTRRRLHQHRRLSHAARSGLHLRRRQPGARRERLSGSGEDPQRLGSGHYVRYGRCRDVDDRGRTR